jgi:hypothetical protein
MALVQMLPVTHSEEATGTRTYQPGSTVGGIRRRATIAKRCHKQARGVSCSVSAPR